MRIILVEPMKIPVIREIGHDLKTMQEIVGGTIQAVYPFDDPVAIVCNDDGKVIGLPENRALYDKDGNMYDILCGTFFIVGLDEEDFTDIPAEYAEKYVERFRKPEIFI